MKKSEKRLFNKLITDWNNICKKENLLPDAYCENECCIFQAEPIDPKNPSTCNDSMIKIFDESLFVNLELWSDEETNTTFIKFYKKIIKEIEVYKHEKNIDIKSGS